MQLDILLPGQNYYYNTAFDFIALGIEAGDSFYVTTTKQSLVIQQVFQNYLIFATNINTTVNAPIFQILRSIASSQLDPLSYTADITGITINNATMTSPVDGTAWNFISGAITADYRAVRKDISGFQTFNCAADVLSMMEVDQWNKLGVNLVYGGMGANGGNSPIMAYIIDSESTADYLTALDDLSTNGTPYYLVPLSNDSIVVNAYNANVTANSDWTISQFRLLLTSVNLVTENQLVQSDPYTQPHS